MSTNTNIVLESGLDLRQLVSRGSILHINEDFNEDIVETEKADTKGVDFIGEAVKCFKDIEKDMVAVDKDGMVKKKILEEGGGNEINDECTVSLVFSGYWENEPTPFEVRPTHKPLIVDLKDNGLLPGLLLAVKSMLVGETSVFLLSYKVMYGDMGVLTRIKPKSDCIFYIKMVRSIITPKEGPIKFSEPNSFTRVYSEAKMLYTSGVHLYKSKNTSAAINLFKKAVNMLHRSRLADDKEETDQEKLLMKLYINLAICYNAIKLPLKACIACNEYNRLSNIWQNGKLLFQNAKALRMIGVFNGAQKRLNRAIQLCPDNVAMQEEFELLQKTREACNQTKLMVERIAGPSRELISQEFKNEVDNLIKSFKTNPNLCKLTLPGKLNIVELEYIQGVCLRENIFCNKIQNNFALDKVKEELDFKGLPEDLEDLFI